MGEPVQIPNREELLQLLLSLKPRQKICLTLAEVETGAARVLLEIVNCGVFQTEPTTKLKLLYATLHGWPEGWRRQVVLMLDDSYRQPDCSDLIAALIWWGLDKAQVMEE